MLLRPRSLLAFVAALLVLATLSGCGAQGREPAADQAGGERVVTHAMGKTSVSGTPKRVVVLGTGELDAVLALGVKPVGAVRPAANQPLQPYLADKAGDVEMVGTVTEPNLERIAALQPDLILSSKVRNADKYDELSRIAPTVLSETVGKTWKENFLLAAEALGKQAQARKILDNYRRKADEVGKRIGEPSRLEVSMVRFTSGGNDIRLYGKGSFIGTVLEDVGLRRPAIQRTDKTFTEVSREQLAKADGDVLFHAAYGTASKARQDEIIRGAQWQNLNAVRNGTAYAVPDDLWYLGLGPIAADLVLDDLGRHLAKH